MGVQMLLDTYPVAQKGVRLVQLSHVSSSLMTQAIRTHLTVNSCNSALSILAGVWAKLLQGFLTFISGRIYEAM